MAFLTTSLQTLNPMISRLWRVMAPIGILWAILYAIGLIILRLYLSPIARVPGPKLAALTGWVETYYDVFKSGKFIFELEKWHERYGPIVRIGPNEVHIADPEYYDVLYSSKSRHDKIQAWKHRFGLPNCVNDTIPHDDHRRRRMAIGPFFSRQKVLDFSPNVQAWADQLCERLLGDEFRGTQQAVCLDDAYAALTSEIIVYYSFALKRKFLEYADFKTPFTTAIGNLAASLHMSGHFPWTLKLFKAAPLWLVAILNPDMIAILDFHAEIRQEITRLLSDENQEYKHVSHKTVFYDLLDSPLLTSAEKSPETLKDEAAGLAGAGIETSKRALAVASFFVLADERILRCLRQELQAAIADPSQIPTLPELEALPYLSAVINEALRLSPGISQRFPRVNPHQAMTYGEYTLPPGTHFSMSNWLQQRDPSIFCDPDAFIPERWFHPPGTPPELLYSKSSGEDPGAAAAAPPLGTGRGIDAALAKYSTPFGRGPRHCLGMALAWAELYIVLATVFRRVDMELYNTGRDAVAMEHDYFIPFPKKGTKGVRVLIGGKLQ